MRKCHLLQVDFNLLDSFGVVFVSVELDCCQVFALLVSVDFEGCLSFLIGFYYILPLVLFGFFICFVFACFLDFLDNQPYLYVLDCLSPVVFQGYCEFLGFLFGLVGFLFGNYFRLGLLTVTLTSAVDLA